MAITAKRIIPVPASAARISLSIMPFGFWWKPVFVYKRSLTEQAFEGGPGRKYGGSNSAWFQISESYGRWL